jgi:hypothetical protein
MPVYYQVGDAITGEKIAFQCRKYIVHKRPVKGTSAHRARTGTLDNAFCVINKRFRHIPEKK